MEIKDGVASEAIGRLFFDVIFFILITTIGLNIVFGIIVDAFSELRDAKVYNNNKSNTYDSLCRNN